MKKPILFKEYIWLLNTIRRAGKISFEELNEKWLDTDMSEGMPLTKATFGRHRIAIEDIFGIIIECQRQGGYLYYISNPNALHDDRIQNWMLSTLSVSNVISESAGLKDRILLEPVADDNGYLQMVIDAMKKNVRIAIVYNRYGGYNPRNLNFEPYALKMWHQRWYVLGHFHRDATEDRGEASYFGIFSFDRIMSMELTDIKFTIDPDFSAEEYFSECFGVVQGDEFPTERIVLRAYDMERFYIQDLPLHHSQRLVSKCEDYADFELYLRPTADFCAQILSRGKYLKVIKPQWLADEIREKHKECLE
jgi:hypothetical protein